MIFLTRAAREVVGSVIGAVPVHNMVIPHGIDEVFLRRPRAQEAITSYSATRPFRWLYVSIVDVYKHQWNVVAAVARLREMGMPVILDLVGPAYPPALRRLRDALKEHDPLGQYVRYHGPLSGDDLVRMYHGADAFVFASTCENMPIILLEGMAAGLPIVCGDRRVMREVLQDGGEYGDPEAVDDLTRAMATVSMNADRRRDLAERAFALARAYSWDRTTETTFAFLRQIATGVSATAEVKPADV
jgi:glycosyltransferase involved in cell wall biosynthesis